jgi:hypothetical protein
LPGRHPRIRGLRASSPSSSNSRTMRTPGWAARSTLRGGVACKVSCVALSAGFRYSGTGTLDSALLEPGRGARSRPAEFTGSRFCPRKAHCRRNPLRHYVCGRSGDHAGLHAQSCSAPGRSWSRPAWPVLRDACGGAPRLAGGPRVCMTDSKAWSYGVDEGMRDNGRQEGVFLIFSLIPPFRLRS